MDYVYIRAWGQMLGSNQSYIDDEVGRARADGAPSNATYRRQDGTWSCFTDVTSATTIDAINRITESRGWST